MRDRIMLSNWLDKLTGNAVAWVCHGGYIRGRHYYVVVFEDGTDKDYFIDFERKTAEEVEI